MKVKLIAYGLARGLLAILLLGAPRILHASISLEGQNEGSTSWSAGNLQNWEELDFIPCRVHFETAAGNNQTITVEFEHINGGSLVPGIQNLFNFSTSANIVFTSLPTLYAPPTEDTWSYTFTINVLNNQPGDVFFFARLAAGAHLNVGSSLALSGKPSSMGNLQIHKPAPGPGTPDLMVVKRGPALTRPGDIITYVLSYTNRTTGFNPATGVQLSDILPPQVTVLSNTIPAGGRLAGNTIFWDLPNLPLGAGGSLSFQVQVNANVPYGSSFTNFSQILSAENDLDYADNSSRLVTATISCASPSVTVSPPSATRCPGDSVTFTATANGSSPLSYQWRKDGTNIAGATVSTYTISPIAASHAGSYSVTVSNLCGSAISQNALLTVTAPPTITCASNKTVELGNPWNFDLPSANYPVTVVGTVTNTTGFCGRTFEAIRTFQAGDTCGRTAQCSQKVTVVDTTAPVITCINTNKTVELGAPWTFDPPSATDNSGSNTITEVSTVTNRVGHCDGTYDVTRIWQATDPCNNFARCSQRVNVIDTTGPVINCSNTNKSVELGSAWTFDPPTATDNSGSHTIIEVSTVTNSAGHCDGTFDAIRTWQAVDGCSNASALCSQTVRVVDTTAPIITCSNTNKTVELGASWNFDPPTATDNSGTNIITVVSTVTNRTGHCDGTFDATRTWKATDLCGNFAQCSQTVNVVDTTAPVITCSNTNKTVELGAAWSFDPPTATDNSGSNTIIIVSTVTNRTGHCDGTFDATRTWKAEDGCGNSAQCSQTVNVLDTTAPVITCSNSNKTVELGTTWDFDIPTATDNSGSNIITVVTTVTNTAGHCDGTFDVTRIWQATDICGNSARCSQKVTVVDTTAPVIACSNTNKTVEQGSAWTFDLPTATDNSGSNTITIVGTVTNTTGHCGTTFDATRTWQATDGCGNFARCSQKVTVVDTTAPLITCINTNKTVEQGSVWTFDPPTATDNSGSNTITIVGTVTNTVGHCGTTFDAIRTWQATDACGNFARCSQKVTVVDTTAPVITCSNTNKTVEQGAAWTFDPPTATDNSGSNTITVVGTTTNTTGHCGTTFDATRTWQATDACGNFARCSQTVTVVDTTAPVITCSNTNKTIEQGSSWTFDPPTATDNSGSNTITVVSTVTNTVDHCGTTFDATRTWQATDPCGNFARCSQKVTVVDTTAPVIACSNTNKTVEQGAAWTFDLPTATDNSGSNTITVVSTVTNTTDHCGTTFDATRTWQATDACGNFARCSQKVTVVDTTAPVITCSNTNKSVEQGADWSFDLPTATDNSGSNTITIVTTVTNRADHCGTTFDATRTWQATDACGNFARCSQKVTVVDTTAPIITCSNTNKTVEQGVAWSFDPPTATDNSGSNNITIVSTVTNTLEHCGSTFDATRTWQATDACGNFARCSQKVTVVDTTAPKIICSNTNKTVEQGAAWTFDPPTATDNSGSNTITVVSTITNRLEHCGTTFDATRTWQATDACGNFARCSQKVTVVDTTAPVITCSNTNKTVEQGNAWTFDEPTATDNSGSNTIRIVITVTNTLNHCGTTFAATRLWEATDACGNSARCSQTVNVLDTTAPVITCSNTNKTVEQGTAWTFDPPTATDNSGSNTITVVSTVTNTVGHCGTTFDATRTWQATDGCGNFARCSQKVIVVDTTTPVITCINDNKLVQVGTAWTFDMPSVMDNSGSAILSIVSTSTNTLGHCGASFDATRTWQAIDGCSNSARCSQTVLVVDTNALIVGCPDKIVECDASWTFDAPTNGPGASNTIVVVSTVTNTVGHCGNTFDASRTWEITDPCGNRVRCTQMVSVVDTHAPVITCSSNKTVQAGVDWSFDPPVATDNCGSATITIASTVTNNNCGGAFTATRTWEATDACANSVRCSQQVIVIDTTAPTVTIISPTNGAQFVAPANFTVLADAADAGGTIARVEFFSGTNLIGQTTNIAPYFVVRTNVPAGTYTFTVKAIDGCGLAATSAPVTVTVLAGPPMIVGPVLYDPQTDIFKQRVRFTNPTYSEFLAVRVYVSNLTNSPPITVCNASGTTNGIPYVQTQGPVAPGSFVDLVIEYCSPLRKLPNPVLEAQLATPSGGASYVGIPQHIQRGLRLANGTFLVIFASASNRVYVMQYSADLVNWKSAQPPITGTGNWLLWIDNGQPKTESEPALAPRRFYRLIQLP